MIDDALLGHFQTIIIINTRFGLLIIILYVIYYLFNITIIMIIISSIIIIVIINYGPTGPGNACISEV